MRSLFILRGIPASGKSTLASEMIRKEPNRFIRINRDDLRCMVVGNGNNPYHDAKRREDLIRSMKETLVLAAFDAGYDVILDDTHLVESTLNKLHKLAASYGDVTVYERGINIDIKDAIERDNKRQGFARVGEDVIMKMARAAGLDKGRRLQNKESYYGPKNHMNEKIVQDESLPSAIICDLDGTLAIIGDRSPYDAANCDVIDVPNWPVIRCVLAMYHQCVDVIFMSGRDKKYRPETKRFIEKYCTDNGSAISYELHMRGDTAPDPDKDDTRKDAIIKRELFDKYVRNKYNVLFVLDDRNQVVDEWRRIGLTVFQVAEGDF